MDNGFDEWINIIIVNLSQFLKSELWGRIIYVKNSRSFSIISSGIIIVSIYGIHPWGPCSAYSSRFLYSSPIPMMGFSIERNLFTIPIRHNFLTRDISHLWIGNCLNRSLPNLGILRRGQSPRPAPSALPEDLDPWWFSGNDYRMFVFTFAIRICFPN